MANMRKAYSERVNELREQMNSMKAGRSLMSYSKTVERGEIRSITAAEC